MACEGRLTICGVRRFPLASYLPRHSNRSWPNLCAQVFLVSKARSLREPTSGLLGLGGVGHPRSLLFQDRSIAPYELEGRTFSCYSEQQDDSPGVRRDREGRW